MFIRRRTQLIGFLGLLLGVHAFAYAQPQASDGSTWRPMWFAIDDGLLRDRVLGRYLEQGDHVILAAGARLTVLALHPMRVNWVRTERDNNQWLAPQLRFFQSDGHALLQEIQPTVDTQQHAWFLPKVAGAHAVQIENASTETIRLRLFETWARNASAPARALRTVRADSLGASRTLASSEAHNPSISSHASAAPRSRLVLDRQTHLSVVDAARQQELSAAIEAKKATQWHTIWLDRGTDVKDNEVQGPLNRFAILYDSDGRTSPSDLPLFETGEWVDQKSSWWRAQPGAWARTAAFSNACSSEIAPSWFKAMGKQELPMAKVMPRSWLQVTTARPVLNLGLQQRVQAPWLDQDTCAPWRAHLHWLAQLGAGQSPDLAVTQAAQDLPANLQKEFVERHDYFRPMSVSGTRLWQSWTIRNLAEQAHDRGAWSRAQARDELGAQNPEPMLQMTAGQTVVATFDSQAQRKTMRIRVAPESVAQITTLLVQADGGFSKRLRIEPALWQHAVQQITRADQLRVLLDASTQSLAVASLALELPAATQTVRVSLDGANAQPLWLSLSQSMGRAYQWSGLHWLQNLQSVSMRDVQDHLRGSSNTNLPIDVRAALAPLKRWIQSRVKNAMVDAKSDAALAASQEAAAQDAAAWWRGHNEAQRADLLQATRAWSMPAHAAVRLAQWQASDATERSALLAHAIQTDAEEAESWLEPILVQAWLDSPSDEAVARGLVQGLDRSGQIELADQIEILSRHAQAREFDAASLRQSRPSQTKTKIITPTQALGRTGLFNPMRALRRDYFLVEESQPAQFELQFGASYELEVRAAQAPSAAKAVMVDAVETGLILLPQSTSKRWLDAFTGDKAHLAQTVRFKWNSRDALLKVRAIDGSALLHLRVLDATSRHGNKLQSGARPCAASTCASVEHRATLVHAQQRTELVQNTQSLLPNLPPKAPSLAERDADALSSRPVLVEQTGAWLCGDQSHGENGASMTVAAAVSVAQWRSWLQTMRDTKDIDLRDGFIRALSASADDCKGLLARMPNLSTRWVKPSQSLAHERVVMSAGSSLSAGNRRKTLTHALLPQPTSAQDVVLDGQWQSSELSLERAHTLSVSVQVAAIPSTAKAMSTHPVVQWRWRKVGQTHWQSDAQNVNDGSSAWALPLSAGQWQLQWRLRDATKWVALLRVQAPLAKPRQRFDWASKTLPLQVRLDRDAWLLLRRIRKDQASTELHFARAGVTQFQAEGDTQLLRVERIVLPESEARLIQSSQDAVVQPRAAIADAENLITPAMQSMVDWPLRASLPMTSSIGLGFEQRTTSDEDQQARGDGRWKVSAQLRHQWKDLPLWHRHSVEAVDSSQGAPLIALKNDLWWELPHSPWRLEASLNAFTQSQQGQSQFAALGARRQVEIDLTRKHEWSAQIFGRGFDGVSALDDFSDLDFELATPYKLAHRNGWQLGYGHRNRAWLDGEWLLDVWLRGNPWSQNQMVDHYGMLFGFRHYRAQTIWQLDLRNRWYQSDAARASASQSGLLHLGLDHLGVASAASGWVWFADVNYHLQDQNWGGQFGLRYDFRGGRGLQDYAPSEWAFRDLLQFDHGPNR